MVIQYAEADVSVISSESKVDAELTVQYFSDYAGNVNTSRILVGVFISLGILFSFYQFYAFTLRNPSD